MRISILTVLSCLLSFLLAGCGDGSQVISSRTEMPFGDGTLILTPVARNAVRIQFEKEHRYDLPDTWLYPQMKEEKASDMRIKVSKESGEVSVFNAKGDLVTRISAHELMPSKVQDKDVYRASIVLDSPDDEYITGLGQFQDGLGNLRGAMRRLTQVNTQISIPFMLSDRGYGILWNNYGMTEYNPSSWKISMESDGEAGDSTVVNVTSAEGGTSEVRHNTRFKSDIDIPEEGDYAVLLDVGQKMARRHSLWVDGDSVFDVRNLWLPPTMSAMLHLGAGKHSFVSDLNEGDEPTLCLRKVDNTTTLSSPVADRVDYTVFVGTADEIIASYRNLTGNAPMMPEWALGYIHCRERYHSTAEILENARIFRERKLPVDVIVQDWQYWGKYGWNAMRFDEDNYPDPSALVSELHDSLSMRLMLSVWSKIDEESDLGRMMKEKGYYIPGTTWIDFFNQNAADEYWKNFSQNLLVHRIDAWWQDATEPENDDLEGRRVQGGELAGEQVRNVYPLLVSKTIYEGLRKDDPERRAMILTRSGFPGIQRYGSTLWSGDVGYDWETLRRQILGGLGLMAAGHPWWTYDSGGFFRPENQYGDNNYRELLVRWTECATFLPVMRIHGYISETEPWRYGDRAENAIRSQLELRYRLLPYIYTAASEVSRMGSTLMRPLIFDFAQDKEALSHGTEFMFGKAILVNPVLKPHSYNYDTYLPKNEAGWYGFDDARFFEGGQTVNTEVSLEKIPVFVKGGSILPLGPVKQFVQEKSDAPMEIRVYAGADAEYSLYEDDGTTYGYEKGEFSLIRFSWDDKAGKLTISPREGSFKGMETKRKFHVVIIGKDDTKSYDEEI